MTPPLIADTATAGDLPWRIQVVGKMAHVLDALNDTVTGFDVDDLDFWQRIVEAGNSHASLKARVAELEANERAYEAALGQRTYNEVALHIQQLEGALRPFAEIAKFVSMAHRNARPIVHGLDVVVLQRLTIGDLRAAARALTTGDAS